MTDQVAGGATHQHEEVGPRRPDLERHAEPRREGGQKHQNDQDQHRVDSGGNDTERGGQHEPCRHRGHELDPEPSGGVGAVQHGERPEPRNEPQVGPAHQCADEQREAHCDRRLEGDRPTSPGGVEAQEVVGTGGGAHDRRRLGDRPRTMPWITPSLCRRKAGVGVAAHSLPGGATKARIV